MGCILEVALSQTSQTRMPNSTPVKKGLITVMIRQ